jgi:hypothetical protein
LDALQPSVDLSWPKDLRGPKAELSGLSNRPVLPGGQSARPMVAGFMIYYLRFTDDATQKKPRD